MRLYLALMSLLCAGCLETSYNLATARQEYTMTSIDKEVNIGRKLARRIDSELPQLADERLLARVRDIGRRIVAVCDRQELVYHFGVIHKDEVNAFSLPGGYIYVYKGLIDRVDSDDELAGVIAHEVAHITARHAIKRYESGLGAQLVQLAALASKHEEAAQGMSVAIGASRLAHARDDELEADRLGIKYMRAAGFDGKGMLTFLKKLDTLDHKHTPYLPSGVRRPQYALTHPYIRERLRTVKEALFGSADYIDYLNTTAE